jgi:hypothetical protein
VDIFAYVCTNELDMIQINENDYPTTVQEMTLQQWVDVSDAVRIFEKEPLLQFEAVLKAIGVPDKEIDNVPLSFSTELFEAMDSNANDLELVEEVDGYKIDLSRVFTVKMGKMIDKLHDIGNPTLALIAFFYQDERLTDAEHFDKAHIKHKISKLKDLPAVNFVVAVAKIMEYLTDSASVLMKEAKDEKE